LERENEPLRKFVGDVAEMGDPELRRIAREALEGPGNG